MAQSEAVSNGALPMKWSSLLLNARGPEEGAHHFEAFENSYCFACQCRALPLTGPKKKYFMLPNFNLDQNQKGLKLCTSQFSGTSRAVPWILAFDVSY